jgi:hypothetical protein
VEPRRPPPPPPFRIELDVAQTDWLDAGLIRETEPPNRVGFVVPDGFEAYARILHPAERRRLGPDRDQGVPLRWSEIAETRGKTMHPEVALHALIDHGDTYDNNYWKAISVGEGEWSPAYEGRLPETDALALMAILRDDIASVNDAWFLLWEGYGSLGRWIDGLPRAGIHRAPLPPDAPVELKGKIGAYRHYIVLRGPLDALATWFEWSTWAGPNYVWPDDRAWIVVTEIDGFSTYVGASRERVDLILRSPMLEALPSHLAHRFDGGTDPINGRS